MCIFSLVFRLFKEFQQNIACFLSKLIINIIFVLFIYSVQVKENEKKKYKLIMVITGLVLSLLNMYMLTSIILLVETIYNIIKYNKKKEDLEIET
jgi:hypothetical protein